MSKHDLFFNKVIDQLPPADGLPLVRAYISKYFYLPVDNLEDVLDSSTRKSISDYGRRAYKDGKLNVNEPSDVHAALQEFLRKNEIES